jgi:hypothetical protein
VLAMETRKRKQQPVNFPNDLVEKLGELSKFLFESNQANVVSFSGTVVRVLREADENGMLDPVYWDKTKRKR